VAGRRGGTVATRGAWGRAPRVSIVKLDESSVGLGCQCVCSPGSHVW
jgi:hypothetical protein